jgi:release factor glutamine methyltransferase
MDMIVDLREKFFDKLAELYTPAEINHLWRIFIEEVTGTNPIDRSSAKALTEAESRKLDELTQRLAAGEPYQYVLGHLPFDVLDLVVRPGVLIPRPETEELIDLIKQRMDRESISSLLDIGTGSGCIALSLAHYFIDTQVTAIDISEQALSIAAENALRNELKVSFLQHNILIDDSSHLPTVDLIVSNPPYIARREAGSMNQRVLGYEPDEALFVENDDPLIFYRRIKDVANDILNPEGVIYLELNAIYARDCRDLYVQAGWCAELVKDLSGNMRFLKAWK